MIQKAMVCLALVAAVPASLEAQVSQTFGSGSAVTSVDATADFEDTAALTDNPYEENGLLFSRTSLTGSNNGCGFAEATRGCAGAVFDGNYMYGVGVNGYFSMYLTGGRSFEGLEFQVSNGWSNANSGVTYFWEALRGGGTLATGSFGAAAASVVGFSSAGGFEELRYWARQSATGQDAPAFDAVRAQVATVSVPEPGTYLLMLVGMLGLGLVAKRRGEELA